MASTEPNTALPLNEVAERLGITPDALRMRLRRGKVRGFKRGGRLFVYLDDLTNAASEQGHGRFGTDAAGRRDAPVGRRPAGRPAQRAELAVVVEFQKIELDRILRENERLNRRIEDLLEELRHLREVQQREQILRQQDQNLQAQAQNILERLVGRVSLPAPQVPPEPTADAETAAPTSAEPRTAPPSPQAAPAPERGLAETATPGPGAAAELATEPRAAAPPEVPSEPRPKAWRAAPLSAAPPPPPEPSPKPPPEPLREPGLDLAAARPEPAKPARPPLEREDAAALAEILREVGESLRESTPPVHTSSGDKGVGERRPPGQGASYRGRPFQDPQVHDAPWHAASVPDRESPPTEEERRNAARIMRRLFRGRRDAGDAEH